MNRPRTKKFFFLTCLLRTGCCSPSKRRRTPSYLASSPIHFPKRSVEEFPHLTWRWVGANSWIYTWNIVHHLLKRPFSSALFVLGRARRTSLAKNRVCTKKKMQLKTENVLFMIFLFYLGAEWWGRRAGAPGPPGWVCTAGSGLCRPPGCSWTGSCRPSGGGAANRGCERRLGLSRVTIIF